MKSKILKFLLIFALIICCFYMIEFYYYQDKEARLQYAQKIDAIHQQIDQKQNELNSANQSLDTLIDQNTKKVELYENLKKWNEEIIGYIN